MRVYLAGPEVFLPDARAVLDAKAALTRTYGFEPICPGDLTIPPAPTKHQFGLNISEIDESFMNRADGVIANLTPFRGIAADPGTTIARTPCATLRPCTTSAASRRSSGQGWSLLMTRPAPPLAPLSSRLMKAVAYRL